MIEAECAREKVNFHRNSVAFLAQLAATKKPPTVEVVANVLRAKQPGIGVWEYLGEMRGVFVEITGIGIDECTVKPTKLAIDAVGDVIKRLKKDNPDPWFPEAPKGPRMAQIVRMRLAQLTSQLICSIS